MIQASRAWRFIRRETCWQLPSVTPLRKAIKRIRKTRFFSSRSQMLTFNPEYENLDINGSEDNHQYTSHLALSNSRFPRAAGPGTGLQQKRRGRKEARYPGTIDLQVQFLGGDTRRFCSVFFYQTIPTQVELTWLLTQL
mmetsp:Transcript_30724/g.117548  ORF Transcript_30724/g.117548 Transcript_30724/m.117548 type:complete len:139 (-) Transcript_30724:3754-4170(-)